MWLNIYTWTVFFHGSHKCTQEDMDNTLGTTYGQDISVLESLDHVDVCYIC